MTNYTSPLLNSRGHKKPCPLAYAHLLHILLHSSYIAISDKNIFLFHTFKKVIRQFLDFVAFYLNDCIVIILR